MNWVSVKEKLPDEESWNIVTISYHGKIFTTTDTYRNGWVRERPYKTADGSINNQKVLAWVTISPDMEGWINEKKSPHLKTTCLIKRGNKVIIKAGEMPLTKVYTDNREKADYWMPFPEPYKEE